jgi:DNA-binding response OmpR family regulator
MPEAPLILIVEDDQQVREVIGEYLERRGCRIALANDRAAGERLLRDRDRPALLIGDAALRDGDGLGLAEIARNMGIPALLISGEPHAIERLEGGPLPFLHKPFRLTDLERELARLLPAGQVAGRGISYRIYFRDKEGLTAGRHEFYATDDDAAMMIATLLCDACSDVCETFELWDGTRRVDMSIEQKPALTAEQINAHAQESAVQSEIAIRDSEWLIAQSQRLSERIQKLTDEAARRC